MRDQSKILVWGAFNFEKMPKTAFWSVADIYSKSPKTKLKVIEISNMAYNDS